MPLSYTTPNSLASTSFNALGSSTTAGASSANRATPTTSNLVDALVTVQIKTNATALASVSATTGVYVYAYASVDGTNWPDALGGADAAIANLTPTQGNQLRFLGYIPVTAVTAATLYRSQPMSIAAAFGGVVPPRWAIAIQNQTGAALHTDSNTVTFTEVSY